MICATDKGVCLLEFADNPRVPKELESVQQKLPAVLLKQPNDHIRRAKQELSEYFDGQRRDFSVSLDCLGTDFQKRVWDILKSIPFGETWTYAGQAEVYGNPKAIRAIASANGKNMLSILIPCHRVIGSDGSLTGYSGGIERKKKLLQLENASEFS